MSPEARERTRKSLRSSTVWLDKLIGDIPFGKLAESLRAGMEERLEVRIEPEDAHVEEYTEADRLKAEKYGTAQWTFPGRTDGTWSQWSKGSRTQSGQPSSGKLRSTDGPRTLAPAGYGLADEFASLR